MSTQISRRDFLTGVSAMGAMAALGNPNVAQADPPPEVQRVRLANVGALCFAPQFVAEAFLRIEGFSEVEYVDVADDIPSTLASTADFAMFGGPSALPAIERGLPIKIIAGLHEGCWELFAHEPVNSLQDLEGRSIVITALNGVEHVWLSSIFAYVGMDPNSQIRWVEASWNDRKRFFVERKVDAFLAFPPEPQELRANNVQRVIVDTTRDRPWSQYFCCLFGGRNEFIRRYPVATKRALRAILKAADLCTQEPEWAAQYLVDKGYESRYDIALEVMNSLSYDRWRTDNPADTIRFHGLRLREVGMVKSTPQELIERGSDFSFLSELKKELKA